MGGTAADRGSRLETRHGRALRWGGHGAAPTLLDRLPGELDVETFGSNGTGLFMFGVTIPQNPFRFILCERFHGVRVVPMSLPFKLSSHATLSSPDAWAPAGNANVPQNSSNSLARVLG